MQKSHLALRSLCEGAVLVAIAQVLGYLKLYELPNGGSVNFAMLPIFVYCVRWGAARGFAVSFAFSCLQFLFDGGFAISWLSIVGDYLLAYTALGFAGLFARKKGGIFLGTIVGSVARWAVHYVVGATVWGAYMPDTFFSMTMTTPWIYSAIYNGVFVFLSMVCCLVAETLLYKPMKRQLIGADLKQ